MTPLRWAKLWAWVWGLGLLAVVLVALWRIERRDRL